MYYKVDKLIHQQHKMRARNFMLPKLLYDEIIKWKKWNWQRIYRGNFHYFFLSRDSKTDLPTYIHFPRKKSLIDDLWRNRNGTARLIVGRVKRTSFFNVHKINPIKIKSSQSISQIYSLDWWIIKHPISLYWLTRFYYVVLISLLSLD